jgi:ligand-binding sensor domain-containing protein
MPNLRFVACFVLLICLLQAGAQSGMYNYDLFTTRSGLTHNHILSLAQDGKGYLWVGTRNGLCRYDGQEFVAYNDLFAPDDHSLKNGIDAIFCYENEVWVGTKGNLLAWLDTKTGNWTRVKLNHTPGYSNYSVRCILKTKHFGTFVGLYDGHVLVLDQQNRHVRTYKVSDLEVRAFHVRGNEVLIYADKLYRYNTSGVIAPVKTAFNFTPWPASAISGDLVFTPSGDGFCYYSVNKQKIVAVTGHHREYTNPYLLASSNCFIVADNNAVDVFDMNGRIINTFLLNEKDRTRQWELINAMLSDKEGNIWLATHRGLVRIVARKYRFTHFTENHRFRKLSHNYIRALYAEDNTIWACTHSGYINKIEYLPEQQAYHITPYPYLNGKKYTEMTANAITRLSNGELIAGGAGLLRFNGSSFEPYRFSQQQVINGEDYVWMIKEDKAERVWISSLKKPHNKLYVMNRSRHIDAYDHDVMVWNMHEDKTGQIWLCTENGLEQAVTNPATGKLRFIHHTNFARNKPAGVKMWGIVEDHKGNLWISTTDNGLVYYDTHSRYFTSYTEKDGLPGNTLSGLLLVSDKQLWIGSINGLAMMDLSRKTFVTYTEEDGLINNDFNFKACTATPRGELFWGTKAGIMSFFPDSIRPGHINSPVVITDVNIMGKKVYQGDTIFLMPGEKMLDVKFALLELTYHNHYYRYRLHGFNPNWLTATERNPVATYTNLPPGEYLLEVQAAITPGNWLPRNKQLLIIVNPALWQRSWFIVLCVLIVLCIAAFLIYMRFRKVVRQEREKHSIREKISELELSALQAQMNPHFIFNAIHSIQHFIVTNDEINANEYLTKFANLMRLFLESSKKKFIPLAREIGILTLYTQLETLRFENHFDVQIIIDPEIDTDATEIPSMLLQPFVENAIIHGLVYKKEKGLLLIRIAATRNGIRCTIDDNGIGREASRSLNTSKHTSRGLELILDRVNSYNELHNSPLCSIHITDKKDSDNKPSGTRIDILINNI